jgi:tRNA dimethylallyltransferase
VVTPDVPYNAGRYVVEARRAATAIHARRKIVVLAGGTGLYIRAFLEGLLAAGAADPELRERLEREDAQARAEGHPQRLHAKLEAVDPEAAARIHVNDARRIIRALEIVQHTGQPSAWLRDAQRCADRPFRALQLALDPGRETLDRRIDAACARMLEAGLLREVRGLCERRYGPELAPMQAIGYRHLLPVVQGADTLRNALAAMQRDTRRFARRQRTWLRGVPETRWFDPAARDAIFATVEEFLRGAEAPALHSV